jgi:hypothetical protein
MIDLAVAKKKPGPKPDPSKARDATTMVRSTQPWKEWVERLAEHERAPSVSDLIDRALVAYARQVGFKEGAPRR